MLVKPTVWLTGQTVASRGRKRNGGELLSSRRAGKNPLNLSQRKFLESRLCRMQLLSLGLPQGVFRPSHAARNHLRLILEHG